MWTFIICPLGKHRLVWMVAWTICLVKKCCLKLSSLWIRWNLIGQASWVLVCLLPIAGQIIIDFQLFNFLWWCVLPCRWGFWWFVCSIFVISNFLAILWLETLNNYMYISIDIAAGILMHILFSKKKSVWLEALPEHANKRKTCNINMFLIPIYD